MKEQVRDQDPAMTWTAHSPSSTLGGPIEIPDAAAMVRQGMQEGAMGMTAGLEYVPGRFGETKEAGNDEATSSTEVGAENNWSQP